MSTSKGAAETGRGRYGLLRWGAIILGVATLLGFAVVLQIHYSHVLAGRPADLWETVAYWLPDWYVWAALSPFVLWLGRRVPPEQPPHLRRGAFHLVAGLFFAVTELALSCTVISVIVGIPSTYSGLWGYFTAVLPRYSVWGLVIYTAILAAGRVYDTLRTLGERELMLSRLEERLARSELRALRMQLQPHFLFNALHSVGSLVRTGDGKDALATLEGIGDLLRYSLENVGRQLVPLRDELDFVRRYLAIQQIRFRDRLEVVYEVDPETLKAEVPNLIIQPLVENAVHHAVAPFTTARTLKVGARHQDGQLRLTVEDDGPGLPSGGAENNGGNGIGIRNVRERLELIYGDSCEFALTPGREGGTRATLMLPFRHDGEREAENLTREQLERRGIG